MHDQRRMQMAMQTVPGYDRSDTDAVPADGGTDGGTKDRVGDERQDAA